MFAASYKIPSQATEVASFWDFQRFCGILLNSIYLDQPKSEQISLRVESLMCGPV